MYSWKSDIAGNIIDNVTSYQMTNTEDCFRIHDLDNWTNWLIWDRDIILCDPTHCISWVAPSSSTERNFVLESSYARWCIPTIYSFMSYSLSECCTRIMRAIVAVKYRLSSLLINIFKNWPAISLIDISIKINTDIWGWYLEICWTWTLLYGCHLTSTRVNNLPRNLRALTVPLQMELSHWIFVSTIS